MQTSRESPSLQMSAFLHIRRKEKGRRDEGKMQMLVLRCSIGPRAKKPKILNESSNVSCWFHLMELKLVLVICISVHSEWRAKYGLTFPLFKARRLDAKRFRRLLPPTLTSELAAISGSSRFATNHAIVTAELQQQADGNNPPPRGMVLLSKN